MFVDHLEKRLFHFSFGEMAIPVFAYFLNQVICFSVVGVLDIFWILILYHIYDFKYFSHFIGCFFIVDCVLLCTEVSFFSKQRKLCNLSFFMTATSPFHPVTGSTIIDLVFYYGTSFPVLDNAIKIVLCILFPPS